MDDLILGEGTAQELRAKCPAAANTSARVGLWVNAKDPEPAAFVRVGGRWINSYGQVSAVIGLSGPFQSRSGDEFWVVRTMEENREETHTGLRHLGDGVIGDPLGHVSVCMDAEGNPLVPWPSVEPFAAFRIEEHRIEQARRMVIAEATHFYRFDDGSFGHKPEFTRDPLKCAAAVREILTDRIRTAVLDGADPVPQLEAAEDRANAVLTRYASRLETAHRLAAESGDPMRLSALRRRLEDFRINYTQVPRAGADAVYGACNGMGSFEVTPVTYEITGFTVRVENDGKMVFRNGSGDEITILPEGERTIDEVIERVMAQAAKVQKTEKTPKATKLKSRVIEGAESTRVGIQDDDGPEGIVDAFEMAPGKFVGCLGAAVGGWVSTTGFRSCLGVRDKIRENALEQFRSLEAELGKRTKKEKPRNPLEHVDADLVKRYGATVRAIIGELPSFKDNESLPCHALRDAVAEMEAATMLEELDRISVLPRTGGVFGANRFAAAASIVARYSETFDNLRYENLRGAVWISCRRLTRLLRGAYPFPMIHEGVSGHVRLVTMEDEVMVYNVCHLTQITPECRFVPDAAGADRDCGYHTGWFDGIVLPDHLQVQSEQGGIDPFGEKSEPVPAQKPRAKVARKSEAAGQLAFEFAF